MCGIVGYIGSENTTDQLKRPDEGFAPAIQAVLAGLEQLEYRGYDSAGIAVNTGEEIQMRKKTGHVANLTAEIIANPLPVNAFAAIGHTRWATHGAPSERISHVILQRLLLLNKRIAFGSR
ncbi:hypothetical protein [Arcanobacterium hippocoleae]|uniref:Glutamine--fructose-6-phosphate aminotransferase [isomerizing] n=1 Tax=Arcanobacterium hippocoleae TaxID=149017 RepID=A0ABU1T3X8_9ACTO|nr:hypothetical protein [Arcanobacterium hippocoleae]MDR6940087.1 glucosamine 6-phosphate synthetase-like amidotransferase/phosphosugar isomerase protein [Arcanobacterium hippocoleae]